MSSTNQFYPHTLTFGAQSPMYRAFVHVRVHSLTLTCLHPFVYRALRLVW